ncbi:MAG: D-alanyl-D-alanine carboxypeptidase family protein [Actinomycetota bacterium]
MRVWRRRTGRASLIVAVGVATQALLIGLASAQLAPPPTPVPPDGSLSPFPRSLDTPADASLPPDVSAPSAILADLDTGQVLFAKDADAQRPVASLTKIMTGLLVLEEGRPDAIVTVAPDAVIPEDDRSGISALGLEVGERISAEDLLFALLLQSANDAAVALADHVSGSEDRFVRDMNARAATLGMRRTRFRSPNGLDDRGYSTARDLMTLTRTAMAIPTFHDIVATRFHTIPAPDGGSRHIQNRDALLWLYEGATGVKTGYTSRAGYCVVATAEREGRRLVAVVLGAPGDAFSDAASLMDHGFTAFTDHRFVTTGEPGGVVTLPGGSVPVEVGADLSALVPIASLEAVREQVIVDPSAAYPPAPGERVARLKITLPGLTVGRVPLVVASVPPPPPIDDAAWWARAADAVVDAVGAAVNAVRG